MEQENVVYMTSEEALNIDPSLIDSVTLTTGSIVKVEDQGEPEEYQEEYVESNEVICGHCGLPKCTSYQDENVFRGAKQGEEVQEEEQQEVVVEGEEAEGKEVLKGPNGMPLLGDILSGGNLTNDENNYNNNMNVQPEKPVNQIPVQIPTIPVNPPQVQPPVPQQIPQPVEQKPYPQPNPVQAPMPNTVKPPVAPQVPQVQRPVQPPQMKPPVQRPVIPPKVQKPIQPPMQRPIQPPMQPPMQRPMMPQPKGPVHPSVKPVIPSKKPMVVQPKPKVNPPHVIPPKMTPAHPPMPPKVIKPIDRRGQFNPMNGPMPPQAFRARKNQETVEENLCPDCQNEVLCPECQENDLIEETLCPNCAKCETKKETVCPDCDKKEKDKNEKDKKEKERKEKEKKDSKPSMGVVRAGGGKMGINFSKMLAEKLKMAPPGAMKKGAGAPKVDSKPPIMEKTVDMVKLLESQPLQVRKDKKKPAKKVFVLEDE